MKEILVVLGSPNSEFGELMDIAIDRLNCCKSLFDPEKNLILCTGGFGKHFNSTAEPHAKYAIEFLVNSGIEKRFFLEMALSANTVDDAFNVKEILINRSVSVQIITSNFHLKRARFIFDEILPNMETKYSGVGHNFEKERMNQLIEHEKKAVASLIKNGIYF